MLESKLLWETLGRFFYHDLVISVPEGAGPGLKLLVRVFYEDLVEILVKCYQRPLRDLVQVLVRSS